VNGQYIQDWSNNGRPGYHRADGQRIVFWSVDNKWVISDLSAWGFYANTADTPLPPYDGWQVDATVPGVAPVPTLTGDVYVNPPAAGDGSAGSPYEIATLSDLYWVAKTPIRWTKSFKQTADIDASETSAWHGGQGWTPIGNSVSAYFSGRYDGNAHTIHSLYINRAEDRQGLFGGVTQGPLGSLCGIYNLGLTDVNITAASLAGGLAGEAMYVTVSDCYSTGSVATTGQGYGGGLVGYTYHTLVRNSSSECTVSCPGGYYAGGLIAAAEVCTVETSWSTGGVQGMNYVGGAVGMLYNTSVMQDCYSTGNVTGTGLGIGGLIGSVQSNSSVYRNYSQSVISGYRIVGGLVGYLNQSTIGNCYSRSGVTFNNTQLNGGGLVGMAQNGTIEKCFSTGTVTGGANLGGVIGNAITSTITASFWDTQTSGVAASAGGTGKSTAEMKDRTTFNGAGWDDAVWFKDAGINNDYPYLAWENPAGSPMPAGLCSFTAVATANGVALVWKTATEVNNHGFAIERKAMDTWIKIGFAAGSGTTNASKEYSFLETGLPAGRYSYRLKQIDRDGGFAYTQEAEVTVAATPALFTLQQNYPNPCNPVTLIGYQLPMNGPVTLNVYDVIGREVAVLVDGVKEAGMHSVRFDGTTLSSGVYRYMIRAGSFTAVKTLVLIK
jgi:hypothetical protein